jgi:hypothetical protein
MPRAIPSDIRLEIVRRRERNQSLREIAADLQLSHHTVRKLWRAFRDGGVDGLTIGYQMCGCLTPGYSDSVLRLACRLRRAHPRWGATRIRVELLDSLDVTEVPSARVLQRAFQKEGINRPRRPHRRAKAAPQATAPHELWQVDAVEKARLKNGTEVSWLTVSDVYTGARLSDLLSPPSPVAIDHASTSSRAVSPCFHAVGTTGAHPGRQRSSMARQAWLAAGACSMADRVGCGDALDPSRPTAAQRHRRAGQRCHAKLGRPVSMPHQSQTPGSPRPGGARAA